MAWSACLAFDMIYLGLFAVKLEFVSAKEIGHIISHENKLFARNHNKQNKLKIWQLTLVLLE